MQETSVGSELKGILWKGKQEQQLSVACSPGPQRTGMGTMAVISYRAGACSIMESSMQTKLREKT